MQAYALRTARLMQRCLPGIKLRSDFAPVPHCSAEACSSDLSQSDSHWLSYSLNAQSSNSELISFKVTSAARMVLSSDIHVASTRIPLQNLTRLQALCRHIKLAISLRLGHSSCSTARVKLSLQSGKADRDQGS